MIQQGPVRRLHCSWLLARGRVRLRAGGQRARFHLRRQRDYLYLVDGVAEREQLECFLPRLRADDVVYEVGAHIGAWTVFLAQRVPRGTVVAFEPVAAIHGELLANLELNRLGNVRAVRAAVGGSCGSADFGVYPRHGDGRGSLVRLDHHRHAVTVPVVTLDAVAERYRVPAPTVLKIDCEGAEGWVLDGGRGLLADPCLRLIYLELHRGRVERTGHRPEQILQLLADAGFRVRRHWPRSEETLYILERPGPGGDDD